MDKKFIFRIFRWTRFCQKKYEKKFSVLLIFSGGKKNPQQIPKKIKFNQDDYRMYLGILRYIPSSISSLLKNLPVPWTKDKNIGSIIHDSKLLIILDTNDVIIPEFSSTLWSLIWVISRKEKINRIFFNRINFPIFDDDEILDYNMNFKKSENKTLNWDKYLENHFKTWFWLGKIIYDTLNEKKKKKLVYNDNSLKLLVNKVEFQSGLYLNINKINQEKNIKFLSRSYLERGIKKISSFRFIKTFEKKINNFPFLYQKKILLGKKSSLVGMKKHYFNLTSRYQDKFLFFNSTHYKSLNFSFLNRKFEKKLNFMDLIKKNKIFIFDLIKPFFIDLFFSQKRLSLYLNYRFDLDGISTQFYSLIPLWNTCYLERIMLNSEKFSQNNICPSYLILLKNFLTKNLKIKKKNTKYKTRDIFKKNLYFNNIKATWIQTGTEICQQSYKLLSILIKRKGLNYLNLDFNFNLKPIRTLSTKERKKSRFSNTFHFFREFLRFIKLLIDCHLKFYSGFIDFFQLTDGIHFILTHIGKITGIYRYKYKIMKQIKICKSIKKIFYEKFYDFPVPKGPGFGFWAPVWKVWVFFLRGMIPVQERWISNLLSRHLYGRRYSRKTFSITCQRKDSYLDIELKLALINEINNLKGHYFRKSNLKNYIKYSNEAWKNWKSNNFWNPVNLPGEIENLILDYVKTKSKWWVKTACLVRESIIKGISVEKKAIKKNTGRISRLWFKAEQLRQLEYLKNGPYFSKNDSFFLESMFESWIKTFQIQKINVPSFKNKWDLKLLILTLDRIKKSGLQNKVEWKTDSIEQNLLQNAMNNPLKTFTGIKNSILNQRIFSDIGLNFMDNFIYLNPVYVLNFEEKIIDGYLDQYIWYECTQKMLFPKWIKPSDIEINPYLIGKLQYRINELRKLNEKKLKIVINVGKIEFLESSDRFDLILMDKILKKILDPVLISYITSKNNVGIVFKDMSVLNSIGVIKGIQFSGFLIQLYYFIFDLSILGTKNSLLLLKKNQEPLVKKNHGNFVFYIRYISKAIFVISSIDCKNTKKLLFNVQTKLPLGLGSFDLAIVFGKQDFFSDYKNNFSIRFCGFSLFLIENFYFYKNKPLKNKTSNDKEGKKNLIKSKVSSSALFQFECRIKQIIMNSGSTTFTKVANKWNSSILGLITYFREFLQKNKNFMAIFSRSEEKIQIRIKTSLNSKMPSRFPMVLFFAPKELGGLGMFAVSNCIIPENDLKFQKINNGEEFGNTKKLKNSISSLMNFIKSWRNEFKDSKKIWNEFVNRRIQLKTTKKNISFEDVEDLWDKGIPRINTLFQKEREILAFDHGWRLRSTMEKFQIQKNNPFFWTICKHDGFLWNLDCYKSEIIKNLGGLTNILEHSLFKGTYFPTWEGLFWEKSSGFEENLENKKITNAQRSGLNQIPNRRFTLWWSPTINRANIYIGFQVQLDLTGIFMHGKIPTLKISLIQIFRAHLWQKIHQSVSLNLCKSLEQNFNKLNLASVQQEQIHPRKSYKMNSSCADILLISNKKWNVSKPSLLLPKKLDYRLENEITYSFWIDIQLRWGDFDSHDIERYARGKFLDFTFYQNGLYPCKYGIIVALDLSYNIFSGFGYGFPKLKDTIWVELTKIIKTNSALYILRDRIRKGLQLYAEKTPDSYLSIENYFEIFHSESNWIIDDSLFYRVSVHQTILGNIKTKPINGAIIIFIPGNGNLILKVINSDIWKQQKRLSQLARWKAAEEIFNFLQTVSHEERPDKLILLRKSLLDPLEIQLIEYPTILIKYSNFKISFQSLLKIKKIGKKISDSNNCETIFFNLYDNWTKNISAFTAFSRLILILKGLEVNELKMKQIFKHSFDLEESQNFWPFFNNEEWIENEIIIKDLILENFGNKNKIEPETLFQSEIRDIIFGSYNKDSVTYSVENKNNNLHTVSTMNNFGKKLKTVVSNKNINKKFKFTSIKKNFSFKFRNPKILRKIELKKGKNDQETKFYIFPRNLLKKFIFDFNYSPTTFFLVLGKLLKFSSNIVEVRILLLLPSKKEGLNSLILQNCFRVNKFKSLEFLGYGFKVEKKESLPKISDFSVKIFDSKKDKILRYESLIFIYLFILQKKIFVKCLKSKSEPKDKKEVPILLSKKYFGLCFEILKLNSFF